MSKRFRAGLAAALLATAAFAPEPLAPALAPALAPVLGQTAEAAVPAKDFGKLPFVRDAAISPDGKRIALYGTFGGTVGVTVVDLDNVDGKPKGFLLPKGVKSGWIKWANNDRILVEAWMTDELYGTAYNTASTYTYNTVTEEGDWLVTPKRAASLGSRIGTRNRVFEFNYADVVDFLRDDPDHILMAFADEYTGRRPVHKVNVETGRYTTIERAHEDIQGWATDTTGTPRVAYGLKEGAKTEDDVYIRIKDMDGEWKTLEHWPNLDHKASFIGFTPQPNELIIASQQGRDTKGLYIYDLNQKKVTRKLYHNDEYDAYGIVRDLDTQEVIGARFTGDEAETVLFDGHSRTIDRMTDAYSDHQIRYVDVSDGGDTLLFRIAQPYDPGSLLLMRDGDAEPKFLASYRPDLPSEELGLVIPVRYTARDGAKIPAFVTLPPTVNDTAGIKELPFIILPHGGPIARDAKRFDWFAQFFASRGYGVLQMNFRGSAGYGESFMQAGRKNWKTMREDAVDGAKWLVEKGYADADRMCVAGWSFGGYAALLSGVKDAELFQCVVAIASLSDLDGELADMRYSPWKKVARKFITDGFASKDDMRANSPVKVVHEMTLPTFIAHGTLDVNVDYDQHQKLRRALKKSPAKVTEMTFKDDDHYMSIEENRQKMLVELEKFLVKANGKSEFMTK